MKLRREPLQHTVRAQEAPAFEGGKRPAKFDACSVGLYGLPVGLGALGEMHLDPIGKCVSFDLTGSQR